MRSSSFAWATTALLVLAAAPGAAENPPPGGLERHEAEGIDTLYVRPGVAFETYEDVYLDVPVEVAFDEDWDPNTGVRSPSRQLSAADLDAIREEMATAFQAVFAEELEAGGYALAPTIGTHTLRVQAALSDVYINAPERPNQGPAAVYKVGTGRMTLVMELRDGRGGQLLARVIDTAGDTNAGPLVVTGPASNTTEFKRAVRTWSRHLVAALGRLKREE